VAREWLCGAVAVFAVFGALAPAASGAEPPSIQDVGVSEGGSAGRCYVFHVPREQPAGLYRFVTTAQLEPGSRRGLVRRVATFNVK
jgi:hypothetical protein